MAPSTAPSSMNRRRCGSVSSRKSWTALAPSTRPASRMSRGMDCRPARISSIMNGVHCQTRLIITEASGNSAHPVRLPSTPNGDSTQLTMPNDRVEHRGLPQQRSGHRRDQERRDQQGADDAAAEELPVEQQRQQQSEDHRDEHGPDDDDHGVERDLPELAVPRRRRRSSAARRTAASRAGPGSTTAVE